MWYRAIVSLLFIRLGVSQPGAIRAGYRMYTQFLQGSVTRLMNPRFEIYQPYASHLIASLSHFDLHCLCTSISVICFEHDCYSLPSNLSNKQC